MVNCFKLLYETRANATYFGQGGTSQREEVQPLYVAVEATDLDELLKLTM